MAAAYALMVAAFLGDHPDPKAVDERGHALASRLSAAAIDGVEYLGPATPPIARMQGFFRRHLLVKAMTPAGARQAVEEQGRVGECAVAFAISEEVNSPSRQGTIELLARVFEQDPPDLVLLETLTLVRDPDTFETVERVLETGLPVWLSFRRCRHGPILRPSLNLRRSGRCSRR